jgi:hypothetical protein
MKMYANPPSYPGRRRHQSQTERVSDAVRFDRTDHWIVTTESRLKCAQCKEQTRRKCEKCE